ncbi:hypothetical protein DFH07DRAFT_953595 [Mycena maculata]|uniref:Decapping nuclease n=1 Tax=Mycena maculata TaxID=230809 RepID=A0AAD7NQM4_9AGAR|nr:hypothetical protein DFH07DRAFT_953595 [Mycena maculata]
MRFLDWSALKSSKSSLKFRQNRRKIDGSDLLLSSLEPDGPRKVYLGPVRQLTRYTLVETARETNLSFEISKAMRRFVQPELNTNVAQLGAAGYIPPRKSHLSEMLLACLRFPAALRGLVEADVVAERDVLTRFMLPHKTAFYASFVHGVLFLEEVHGPGAPYDSAAIHRRRGFLRACTELYAQGQPAPNPRAQYTMHSVVARQLNGLNLLVSGGVDCIKYEYSGNPGSYMQLVNRPLRDGKYLIRPKVWKEWYLRAHLMGIRSLYLGLIDEAGVLRSTRQLATRSLPGAAAAKAGAAWDPEENLRWAFRVLTALRDYCQEATDRLAVMAPSATRPVWRVEISPLDGETRVLVRELAMGERGRLQMSTSRLVPTPVINAYESYA